MGRYYQNLDSPHFDYKLEPCPLAGDQYIRGPVPNLKKPYFICVGAAQTFGRFCDNPYPEQLSKLLKLPVLNLGLAGAGPKTFLDRRYLTLVNQAKFAVVQVLSGRSESNSAFDSDGSSGPQGIRLRDRKRMRFEAFLREELQDSPHSEVEKIVVETQQNWVASYGQLLDGITVPTVLHWFSQSRPRKMNDFSTFHRLIGHFPQLVLQQMVDKVATRTTSYVETVSQQGMPQPLWKASAAIDGTELHDGMLYNNYYPTPQMHSSAAETLASVCRKLR